MEVKVMYKKLLYNILCGESIYVCVTIVLQLNLNHGVGLRIGNNCVGVFVTKETMLIVL
jgi:hypothetical protein